ncbi:MAG: hypothetical protein K5842_01805 [Bacteroidales bacterium]|nr:hypothetical protein [Bacteroidales bacterium]
MNKQKIQQVIDNVIDSTFKSIEALFKNKNRFARNTRLCIPSYHHGSNENKIRLSEQELRFLFVEEFNKNADVKKLDLRYSVETPTVGWYNNTGERKRSGNFDMTIWRNEEIVAIIEFKAKNRSFETDLKKLTNLEEGDVLRYLVNILEASTPKTSRNLRKKFNVENQKGEHIVYLKFYSLNKSSHNETFPETYKY